MKNLDAIRAACESCRACKLYKTRTNCVFGDGNPDAELMFVGEAPGAKEDLSGRTFIGAAGKLLDKYLEEIGISRSDVYITNILKCRPPNNRDPLRAEQGACIGFLHAQIQLIKPKIVVCLGRIAAMKLIRPDFKITAEHGRWVQNEQYCMTALYHPALLLRDPHKKEDMIVDMKEIKRKLDEDFK